MDSPQINVIGSSNTASSSGPKFSFSPKVAILATVLLAVLAVAGAWLLLRAPKTQFAPAPSHASTTATISDDFSAATIDTSKWSTSQAPGTNPGSQGSGTYNSLIGPSASDSGVWNALVYNQTVSGDFNVQVDIPNFTPSPTSGTVAYAGIKMWQDANNAVIARRLVDQTGNFVDLYVVDNGTVTDGQNVAVPDGSAVTLRLARIGNIVQMFAKIGANSETLIGSSTVQMAGPYQIQLISGLNPGQPQSTLSSSYDNFSGQVNLVGLPSPTPGTAAACALTFNVLSTVPTPTPFPTPTPTGNPTPTPTPTGNPTPTPTPTPTPASTPSATPNSCNGTCGSNANCADGMVCDLTSGRCRNVSCLTSTNCTCASATPTPVASGPTPTPVTQLQQAGSVTGTWIITLSGAAMLILGAIVAFAL